MIIQTGYISDIAVINREFLQDDVLQSHIFPNIKLTAHSIF